MRTLLALLTLLCATAAQAQQRQPANVSTLPQSSPQEFDLLDNTGKWMPFGTASGGVFTTFGAGTDVRSFGCKADGTDQTACINNALANASDCVIIPATPLGFYVAGTITVTRCLRGTVWTPSAGGGDFSNSSRIICNNQVAQPCVVVNRSPPNASAAQIENISILGTGGTPIAGSTGLQWLGGFNLILTNVQSANFGSCAYFGPLTGGGIGPIAMHSFNAMFSRCSRHYVVADGVPELYFDGGRWGENGGTDYNSADDFLYGTKTATGGAGGGPNTIVLDSVHINPGGKTIGCAFRWGNYIDTNGLYGANRFVGVYVEVLSGSGYTGSASRGMFCMDATVDKFPGLSVTTSSFNEDLTKSIPFFNIDPAVPFNDDLKFVNSVLCTAGLGLTVKNLIAQHTPVFDNDYVCNSATFTAGDTSASLTLANNVLASSTIAGKWARLSMNNNSGTLTDSATGAVFESNQAFRAWTPTLTFGGNNVGMTTSVATGKFVRTPNGGFRAQAQINLTAKGTSTGNAVINGLPYTCGSGITGAPFAATGSFTGLTGSLVAQMAGTNPATINILQSQATGNVPITDASFTNTTVFQVEVQCLTTQ